MHEQHLEHDQKVNPPFRRELKRSWSSELPGDPPSALSQRHHGPDDEALSKVHVLGIMKLVYFSKA